MSTRLRWMLGALLALAYALVSHRLTTQAGDSPLALLVVLGPVAGMGLVSFWANGQHLLAAAGIVGALLLALVMYTDSLPVQWLYLLQHAGIHLALGIWFGSTLRAGRQPLISMLAQRVHGQLTPAMARYTRRLTLVWVLYFVAITTASLVLFLSGRFEWWSLLANVLTPLAMLLMFGIEYLLRYRLHPEFERVGFLESIRAWRAHQGEAP
ncbi:MAG: hypothetical protein AB9M60_11860 [Leptothrix sp. (in: b-proteobacteria)]